MLNQLKSEFLKLKYSKLFIAVPILLLAGLILYGSFSLSSGGDTAVRFGGRRGDKCCHAGHDWFFCIYI